MKDGQLKEEIMEKQEVIFYKRIYINCDLDFPEMEGEYITKPRDSLIPVCINPFKKTDFWMQWWMINIDWYLQPVEEQKSNPENEHDLIFKKDAIIKKQDNFLNYLLKYCGTSQRIRQYQFEINELKTK